MITNILAQVLVFCNTNTEVVRTFQPKGTSGPEERTVRTIIEKQTVYVFNADITNVTNRQLTVSDKHYIRDWVEAEPISLWITNVPHVNLTNTPPVPRPPLITPRSRFKAACPYCGESCVSDSVRLEGVVTVNNGLEQSWRITYDSKKCGMRFNDVRTQLIPSQSVKSEQLSE